MQFQFVSAHASYCDAHVCRQDRNSLKWGMQTSRVETNTFRDGETGSNAKPMFCESLLIPGGPLGTRTPTVGDISADHTLGESEDCWVNCTNQTQKIRVLGQIIINIYFERQNWDNKERFDFRANRVQILILQRLAIDFFEKKQFHIFMILKVQRFSQFYIEMSILLLHTLIPTL